MKHSTKIETEYYFFLISKLGIAIPCSKRLSNGSKQRIIKSYGAKNISYGTKYFILTSKKRYDQN